MAAVSGVAIPVISGIVGANTNTGINTGALNYANTNGYTNAAAAAIEAARIGAGAIQEASSEAANGMIEAAQIAAESALKQQAIAIEYMKQAVSNAQGYLDSLEGKAGGEIDKARFDAENFLKTYEGNSEELLKPYAALGIPATAEIVKMTMEGVKVPSPDQSAYKPLYDFQKKQQDKQIEQMLAAKGLSGSGPGLQQQLNADSGLAQAFTADEYQRAKDAYTTKLGLLQYLSGTGQQATGNISNLRSNLGTNLAQLSQWAGGAKGNIDTQTGLARANAAMGAGTQMSNIAQGTGNTLANIYNQQGQGLSNIAMSTGSNLAHIAGNQGTNIANLAMSNAYNAANQLNFSSALRTNQFNNYANLGLAGLNAYLKYSGYNQPDYTTSSGGGGEAMAGIVPNYSGTNAASELWW